MALDNLEGSGLDEGSGEDKAKTSITHDVELEQLKIVSKDCEKDSEVENPGSGNDVEGSGIEQEKLIKRVSRIKSKDKLVLQGQTEKKEEEDSADS
jgi:hypothetical protein